MTYHRFVKSTNRVRATLVPKTGIEPVRSVKDRRILSPVRLPVPPLRHLLSLPVAAFDSLLLLLLLWLSGWDSNPQPTG